MVRITLQPCKVLPMQAGYLEGKVRANPPGSLPGRVCSKVRG